MNPRRLIERARRRQTALMDSTCTITSGLWPDLVTNYQGPCLIRPTERTSRVVESGGATVTLLTYDCWIAADVDLPRRAILTVDSSADPALVGRWMYVIDVTYDDWQATRRLVLEDEQG